MYLSRLILNPRHRDARRDLGDCVALHRTVMSAFPDVPAQPARQALGVLWRLEPDPRSQQVRLLVQSASAPDWSRLPPGYLDPGSVTAVKEVDAALASLHEGMRLQFRLQANPTRKIDTKSSSDGARRNGRRVPLRGDEEIISWLARHAPPAGFELETEPGQTDAAVLVRPSGDLVGRQHGQGGQPTRITIRGFVIEGLLVVRDAELFRQAISQGIGPEKAYGCGMLSVARAGP
ncbi:MAG: type I-E CRISPR-associated protein Cas6/Cse3/CasE [Solirubrobacterales bacterium]